MTKRIEKEKWYSLTDLVSEDLFPWCGGDIRRYRKMVVADKEGDDILKAVLIGSGKARRYQFKGINIIKFIEHFESGKANL